MKSSEKSSIIQYKNVDRKHSKSEKVPKLDRKSSRGMIFENEELRLRTININAEVERGQTDIKRLRRENEHLRREIWTLRDECDRLNKRFKAKILEHEHGNCNVRGSGVCTRCPSQSNSDDSDSCDTCKGDDGHCSDECCQMSIKENAIRDASQPTNTISTPFPKFVEPQNLHNTFDHLSVVSEETLSNSEVQANAQQQKGGQVQQYQTNGSSAYTSMANGSKTTLPGLTNQLPPLTPIDLVTNQMNDLQAVVPPLSYFENILQHHMGSTIGITPDTSGVSPNSKIVKHTNGWDYNLQSPFAHRKPATASSTSSPSSGSIQSPTVKQRYPPATATLTTFLPTHSITPHSNNNTDFNKPIDNIDVAKTHTDATVLGTPKVETVAITTMPTMPPPSSALGSPKYFFSPFKPRLKINTSLATKNSAIPAPPIVPTSAIDSRNLETIAKHQKCDPPDIYVANAVASAYKHPNRSSPLTQRSTYSNEANVSPSQRQRHHICHQHQQQYHYLIEQHQQQEKEFEHTVSYRGISPVLVVDEVDNDFDVDTDAGEMYPTDNKVSLASFDTNNAIDKNVATNHTKSIWVPILAIENGISSVAVDKEPIYAVAQERSCNLISASALTKPLMTAAINLPSEISIATFRSKNTALSAFNIKTYGQVESVNLETILNDIEHISEDILAIQLEKNMSRERLDAKETTEISKPLNEDAKYKKPYRSEMNLLLSYDGMNSRITQTTTKKGSSHSASSDNILRTRARSLERDSTDSPSPKIPDAMPAFPSNRSYLDLEQSKQGLTGIALQLHKPKLPSGSKSATSSPKKFPPPAPPMRMYPLSQQALNTDNANNDSQPTGVGMSNVALGLVPNKSHLYKALANAAAKRGQFLMSSPTLSKSLDTEFDASKDSKNGEVLNTTSNEASPNTGAARKARRVSIVCGESPQTPDIGLTATVKSVSAAHPLPSTPTKQLSTGSCINLTSTPTNPQLQSLKQVTCHSTPNSPHSVRRQSDAQTPALVPSQDDLIRGNRLHYQHQLSNAANHANNHRRSSQDFAPANLQETATAQGNATATRSKCSRRHSDATLVSNVQRISGTNAHHHHHHHHRQHSSSTMRNTHQQNNRQSNLESNLETCSVSDRNSNSLSSSRDSSTSFSMRSQRRKISVSSHTGGKIPWCGCWGNGCL